MHFLKASVLRMIVIVPRNCKRITKKRWSVASANHTNYLVRKETRNERSEAANAMDETRSGQDGSKKIPNSENVSALTSMLQNLKKLCDVVLERIQMDLQNVDTKVLSGDHTF